MPNSDLERISGGTPSARRFINGLIVGVDANLIRGSRQNLNTVVVKLEPYKISESRGHKRAVGAERVNSSSVDVDNRAIDGKNSVGVVVEAGYR